jgi:hypothetical protein
MDRRLKTKSESFKGKVVFVYTTNAYGGMEIQFHLFSSWTLEVGEKLASHLGRFRVEKRVPVFIEMGA